MAQNEKDEKPKIVHTIELSEPKPNLHIVEGNYKGNPMLNLIHLDGFGKPFSFGVGKAKMILYSIKEIEEFYNKHKDRLGKSSD